EEERRLCYVGMTRARSSLSLSYAHTRWLGGRLVAGGASRFVGEIGRGNLELQVSPIVARRPRLASARVGDRVHHTRWGQGTVVAIDGSGRETMVSVLFDSSGRQRLQLCHAPLTRVDEEAPRVRAG
ncbi:MAG TPA: 3'-5' exonuclease, partial [Chloroflexota bacterium]|nr:3'-5' exonuclease [Chloroflexota bacterium]